MHIPCIRKYVKPIDLDILFSQGEMKFHPGNKCYQEEKECLQLHYKVANRTTTTSISRELVNFIHAWGW